MKARLALAGVPPPATHDLRELANLVCDLGTLPLSLAELDALRPFAVAERYPVLRTGEATPQEVAPLVASARAAVAWIDAELRAGAGG